MNRLTLMARLDAHDRALYQRWVAVDAPQIVKSFWRTITHLGGATATIAIVLLAGLFGTGLVHTAGVDAAIVLVATHLVAQAIKRTATRPRPHGMSFEALIAAPDQFSFPSGHSIAASALAFTFAWHVPVLAPVLLVLATLVGVSRVRLGVHYPGDVLAGQAIALLGTWLVVTR
jgi:undecaprenyl-diphosphatase